MTETVQQFLARGGKIQKVPRGATRDDVLTPASLKRQIHVSVCQVGKLRKKMKKKEEQ